MTRDLLARLTRHRGARRDHLAQRRDHDAAMSDPRVAAEHLAAIDRAEMRGEPGCTFCR